MRVFAISSTHEHTHMSAELFDEGATRNTQGEDDPLLSYLNGSVETSLISPRKRKLTMAVLLSINMLNYLDRYTVAGQHPMASKLIHLINDHIS